MTAALLHRRLTSAMALTALAAFAAGAGWSAGVWVAAVALGASLFWLPDASRSVWIERASRLVIVALCGWMLHVAFVLRQDFMPAVMGMLLFLLAAESLRALNARNDTRLYLLSFALLVAATAYYPGLGFAVGFIAFIVLSTLALMVGYLRRQAERYGALDLRIGRRMLLATTALSTVTLLVSGTLFLVFPRLPRQWNVQGRSGGAGDVMAGFGDGVELGQHGGRIVPNPDVAFRVEFAQGAPVRPEAMYWRGRSFDHFNGTRWSRTPALVAPGYGPAWYLRRWGGPPRQMQVFGGPPGATVLFGPHPIVGVRARSAIRTYQDLTGDVHYAGSDAPVYGVTSGAAQPPEGLLRSSPDENNRLTLPYLQLPRLSPRVAALADSLTAGLATRIDRVRAVERYLSTELSYTLELPRSRAEATVEGFLFRRREGHCEYFSTAMVVMLRSAGIPARNVTGFLGGEWNGFGKYLAVTGNDAHSWVEVWFPRLGWVPFDPTPSSRGALIERETGSGWAWPALFWLDGLEHRWYKWVLDYNLEKQLGLFSRVGDLFDRDRDRGAGPRGGRPSLPLVPLVISALVTAMLARALLRRRRRAIGPETRLYLALRRAYERAGIASAGGPLAFAEHLARTNAPGAGHARVAIDLYLRARFAGEDIGDAGRQRMAAALTHARDALRAAPRPRRKRAPAKA
ncbi:MAG TPA: DUF3488 and transglutaminase-like domain-containing protein [Longimicrobium sp.]|nr:DUF3488 and transglutaminase-like domain-containing protein [Longimicrobium sp.]